jgi:hypothetical protein
MADDAGAMDPIAVAVARAELEQVSERRAGRAVAADDAPNNIEAVRRIGRLIILTARRLGVATEDTEFDQLCRRILSAAQGGRLEPAAYRTVWQIRQLLVPHGPPEPQEAR